ncbi:PP2C family protein-serine/threonine phosphatase [Streptomyces sp. CNQ085]|uniref:PP2C family protein-serine/threonine phosphatase n=1 Tax=Streptomyces sp. CNQ085 TaxID=2886944 RepID=UPI001F511FAC|nr:PP2C family protein-serine/threonine phosphatase [Streptomyces sp. CNQ085]MCI0385947.1 serine/threonine-protein phosphatase [Streptomyces sp. CNQ085]
MHGDGRQETGGGRIRVRTIPVIGHPPWLLPLLLILLGAGITLLTPDRLIVGAPFAAAILLTASLWTLRGTVYTVAAVLATEIVLLLASGRSADEVVVRMATNTTVALLALVINRVLARSDVDLASARRVSEAVQLAVLPVPPGRVGELRIAVRYEAAQAHTRIGGDLYGAERTPYGLRMMVGDVRGKGLGAVGTVTVLLGAFREAAEAEEDLAAVADRVEHALLRRAAQLGAGPGRSEEFATAVFAEVPADAPGSLRLVNRGHPPPVLLTGEGEVRLLEPDPEAYALPLGLSGLTGASESGRTGPVAFPPGSLLLLHTDGLTEARNAADVFYDLGKGLRERRFSEPAALLDHLLAEVGAHTGGHRGDDMALMAVMRGQASPPPPAAGDST